MSKNNEGAIWRNDRREKDSHPHYTGSATIDGVDYWVSAWKKSDDAPEKAPLLKFAFRPKQERQEAPRAPAPQSSFADDDIPF